MIESGSAQVMKEVPGVLTPWPKINQLLSSDERFSLQSHSWQGYLLTPKNRSQFAALLFFLHQENIPFSLYKENERLPTEGLNFLMISVRALSHIDWHSQGVVEVGSGCSLNRLQQFLFDEKEEIPLEELPLCSSKQLVGELILSGRIASLRYGGESIIERLISIELITWEGSQVNLGGNQKGQRPGPALHKLIFGLESIPGIITKVIFRTSLIPQKRLRMNWAFSEHDALLKQMTELKAFATSWEYLAFVRPGDPSLQQFIFAQISGSSEEMEAFCLHCPCFAKASLQGDKLKITQFLIDQKLSLSRCNKNYSPQIGDYFWMEEFSSTGWLLSKNSDLMSPDIAKWKELFLQSF